MGWQRVSPAGAGKAVILSGRMINPDINVESLTNVGEEKLAPLSNQNEDNPVFSYDAATRLFVPKVSTIHNINIFSNVNEGAGTADIVFFIIEGDSPTGPFIPKTGGIFNEYAQDGSTLSTSADIELSTDKHYALAMYNDDGGNVIFTTNTFTTSYGPVVAAAFVFQLSRPVLV